MKKFIIQVDALTTEGVFPSSCDAVIAMLEQFPDARRISVRAVKG